MSSINGFEMIKDNFNDIKYIWKRLTKAQQEIIIEKLGNIKNKINSWDIKIPKDFVKIERDYDENGNWDTVLIDGVIYFI